MTADSVRHQAASAPTREESLMASFTTARQRWHWVLVSILGLLLTGYADIARPTAAASGPDDRGGTHVPPSAEVAEALPATLQLAAIRSVARDAAAKYRVAADGRAVNPRHGLALTFTPEGARIEGREGGFALRLARVGRGSGEAVDPATPRIDGAWVEYDRGAGVREWFVNLPRGVEQGWTVTERPAGRGPLALVLDTGRRPDQVDDDRLAWSGLVYHRLVALDAEGRKLPARWTSEAARLRIEVDDTAAVYPVVIDPWVQQAKLTASEGVAGDNPNLGEAVALSGDGNTALVGARLADVDGKTNQGAAYVFTRGDDGWSEQAKLVAPDGAAHDNFATSVALSGNTALVAATAIEKVYVFTRSSGGVWSPQATLTTDISENDDSDFGFSVALEGETAVVGAPAADMGANRSQGAAFVFARSGEAWSQQAMLRAGDGREFDNFGFSVAVSGGTLLVGAGGADVGGATAQGAAYVFTRSNGTWQQQAKLTAGDGFDNFGFSVALSGETALVGAIRANAERGAAYVFTRSGETWEQQARLIADDGAGQDNFGTSVALSEDSALIGARFADVAGRAEQSAAYVFTNSDGTWEQQAKLTPDDGVGGDQFGTSVALSQDTALVGAPADDGNQGAAYVFQFQPDTGVPTTTIEREPPTPDGANRWYTSPVQVTVSATDDIGVAEIRCVLDPATEPATFNDLPEECAFTEPIDVDADGDHTLYAASVDKAGNAGDVVSARLRIDQTVPIVTCETPTPEFALGQADAVVTALVTDETSGPTTPTVSATADTTSPGQRTVSLVGVDVAGNQTGISCPYTVTAPPLTISGTVVDEDEAPVAGVTVTLSGDDQREAITGDDGAFAFADLTWGGSYTVTLTHPDYDVNPNSRAFDPLEADQEVTFTATRLTAVYTRYFGEGAIGSFFDTTFALFNPTDEDAAATLTFAGETGEVVPHPVTIPAQTQVVVDPETLLPAEWVGFATAIEADQTLVTSRTMAWDERHYGRHESAGVATPQTEWWFTEGATGTFQLFYLLYNPGDEAAEVTTTYYRGGEQAAVTRTYTVAPRSRRTVFVNVAADGVTPDPALGDTEVSAHIVATNDVPIVAERALYLTTNAAQPLTAGTIAPAVTAPATSWHFAEGATDFFDLFLLLANPTTAPVEATVRYLLPTGEPVARTYPLAPESRRTIWVDGEDARLAETQVAITVQSDTPILAERAMWWGATGAWDGGHVSTGATRPATRWGLAGITLGGPDTAEAYVLIANPNAAEAEATLTLITPDGTRDPVTVPLGPWSRTTLRLMDLFPDAGNAPAAVRVESTSGENPVPLVVEGAAYASPDHQPLTTGSATPALPLPE
jgi:hypothetical protein